jgi:quercetin dioxygenase-like cupin family protein
MIRLLEPRPIASDPRGSIEGLLDFGPWEEVNRIRSAAGAVRGNHYHRETLEAFIVLSGEITLALQRVVDGRLTGPVERRRVGAGAVFVIEQGVNHLFTVERDAEWLNLLSRRLDPKAPDLLRPLP